MLGALFFGSIFISINVLPSSSSFASNKTSLSKPNAHKTDTKEPKETVELPFSIDHKVARLIPAGSATS